MEYLFTGLMTKFNTSNDFKTAIGSRMYNTIAPAITLFPYAVFQLISNTTDNTFTGDVEEALLQITIVSEEQSVDEVTDAFTKCKALYDETDLTISGYTHIVMLRQNAWLDRIDDKWQYVVEYYTRQKKD